MKSKKHAFAPSLDGKLEDRLVLNAAGAGAVYGGLNAQGQGVTNTRTYNNVLVSIHNAVVQFGRSNGGQAAYARAEMQIANQVNRLPFANGNGLTDEIVGAVQYYNPNEFRNLYSDIRSTLISYLQDEVANGDVVILQSPGRPFSDADLAGLITPNNAGHNGGGHNGYYGGGYAAQPVVVARPAAQGGNGGQWSNVPGVAQLNTRTYNSVLVGVHNAVLQFGRSNGSQAAYNRASMQIGRQINRLPYANGNGLTSYITDSVQFYAPNEFQTLYSDIRSTVISYIGDEVANGDVVIVKSRGNTFSDIDIYGPYARINDPNFVSSSVG